MSDTTEYKPMRTRVIPVLLLQNQGLVKTIKFSGPRYVGDPINIIRIFNEKEVDEIVFLDITATNERKLPNYQMVEDIAGEAFMPVAYGGGIDSYDKAARIFGMGIEKIVINSAAYSNPGLISEIASNYGNQSVVVSMDCKKSLFGSYELYSHSGKQRNRTGLLEHLSRIESAGAGEILINSINRDGTQSGYDIDLLKAVSSAVSVPVVACGGAGNIDDFRNAVIAGGVSAVGAGSMFVFNGKHRAVLVSYPDRQALEANLP